MLHSLQIQNFAIIDQLELEFTRGLTVVTGETGAGKSIIIDALGIVLGERADTNWIRTGQEKCVINASFNIENNIDAKRWLHENDYEAEGNECLLRRILPRDGKARQMINGQSCTLQQLRDLVVTLINIHSQNQHQFLGKRQYQREILDNFAGHHELTKRIELLYFQWKELQKELEKLSLTQQNFTSHCELINYQIRELDKLGVVANEYEQLDEEHKQLANAEHFLKNCYAALGLLSDAESNPAQDTLYSAQNYLQSIQHPSNKITTAQELLNNSILHLEECIAELRSFIDHVEVNPERLNYVEERISKIHELARKHHVTPQQLHVKHSELMHEVKELNTLGERLANLQQTISNLEKEYFSIADKLSKSRETHAKKLNSIITEQIQNLGMPGGQFKIQIDKSSQEITAHGCDSIDFLVCANPGQSLQPLNKVASGGETSRIALAIYVTTAQKNTTPVLVFDEVDVGIGGSTAAIVGKMLRALAKNVQIICITHLPQVAAFGHNHLRVEKQTQKNNTITSISSLNSEERISEIARMLGGITITQKTLEHARELLESETV